jgi:hypothetical protein
MTRHSGSAFAQCFWALIITGILVETSPVGHAQVFRNLGFEDARIICSPDWSEPSLCIIEPTNAVPGWTITIGGFPTLVVYDTISLGAAEISIHDKNGNLHPISGNFSVLLQSSWDGQMLPALSQTGVLPASAKSMFFMSGPGAEIRASFKGEEIPLTEIGDPTHPTYTWGGDVSTFAGQTGALSFWGNGWLDGISFSSGPIPKPPSLSKPKLYVDGSFEFLLLGQTGQSYTLQYSTNFTNWTALTNVAGSVGPITIMDLGATNAPARFYRAVSP